MFISFFLIIYFVCECTVISDKKALKQSDYVFTGKVISIKKRPYAPHIVRFKIVRKFKAKEKILGDEFLIYSGPVCRVKFSVGSNYIVFGNVDSFYKNEVRTDRCMMTREIGNINNFKLSE
jgi:hypothetical protein